MYIHIIEIYLICIHLFLMKLRTPEPDVENSRHHRIYGLSEILAVVICELNLAVDTDDDFALALFALLALFAAFVGLGGGRCKPPPLFIFFPLHFFFLGYLFVYLPLFGI